MSEESPQIPDPLGISSESMYSERYWLKSDIHAALTLIGGKAFVALARIEMYAEKHPDEAIPAEIIEWIRQCIASLKGFGIQWDENRRITQQRPIVEVTEFPLPEAGSDPFDMGDPFDEDDEGEEWKRGKPQDDE